MIFFLTDGHPTQGVTDTVQILENVREANKDTKAAIFSLAFGMHTDFGMLKTLSVQNYGFARKIYTASDASLQLEGLYKEVSSPILSQVEFNYLDSSLLTQSITETVFHTFYQGGEMIVAGILDAGQEEQFIEYEITATQSSGQYIQSGNIAAAEIVPISETVDTYIDFLPDTRIEYNFLERLWAYLTVQNLFSKLSKGELVSCVQPGPLPPVLDLEKEGAGDGLVICNNLERALYLSLRYQFVTPLTSLVVVKPDRAENGDIGEADRFQDKLSILSGTPSTLYLYRSTLVFVAFLYVLY
ncbi:inter-alpha-trypsin inhibitor heavy chain H4 [Eurytemora carolleeae]|uniref:inter-alpha-trypsin inhibitor heavy chain H4 n=1 Tax=Eurytemora carolleeae TaxID=1294199 RepID=UPI000C780486|nr:inter-alpha-trypsin inhibitor heavy chain H4 [Eurytemora carolleeae]|eukprot:XP_023341338.1 inter-alpha-trypsin inhibitor heavy chain H4-like [Eurytemora affinis]